MTDREFCVRICRLMTLQELPREPLRLEAVSPPPIASKTVCRICGEPGADMALWHPIRPPQIDLHEEPCHRYGSMSRAGGHPESPRFESGHRCAAGST